MKNLIPKEIACFLVTSISWVSSDFSISFFLGRIGDKSLESGFLFIILHLLTARGISNCNIGEGVWYHHEFNWKNIHLSYLIS